MSTPLSNLAAMITTTMLIATTAIKMKMMTVMNKKLTMTSMVTVTSVF